VVGATLQLMGEELCEAADLHPDQRVLDVATGNGGTAIAAARRFCDVTGVDYVPALLARARQRADAEGYAITFTEGDAEDLQFGDASFDAVTSTLGVMFTADHDRAGAELLRVCRPGGVIALANWTPDGFVGRLFQTIGTHRPPPPGASSPALWGTESYLQMLLGDGVSKLSIERRHFVFRYRSVDHFVDVFRTYYGPVLTAFESLDDAGREALASDLRRLLTEMNTANGYLAVPAAYLQVIATRS
jgi:SAM-dependent methyltransferase